MSTSFIGICQSQKTIDLYPLCSIFCGCEDQFESGSPYHTWNMWWWSILSRVQAWADYMENLGCPCIRIHLSALLVCSKGKETEYIWYQFHCRNCRRCVIWSQICLKGFTPDFLSGFTPLAFASPKAPTRQSGYLPIVGDWSQWF